MLLIHKKLTSIAGFAIFLLVVYVTTYALQATDAQDAKGSSSSFSSSSYTSVNETRDLYSSETRHSRQLRQAENVDDDDGEIEDRSSDAEEVTTCSPGLVLPLWMPQKHLSMGDRALRGLVYFLLMIYLFVGVSIISDRFMGAIEAITSIERTVTIKAPDGSKQSMRVRVWNETVANLTLMALGSSAPENSPLRD